jgi:uncharacterized protein (DUF488 family)
MPTDPVRVQIQKKRIWNDQREKSTADFFTVGYSGRTIDDFLDALKDAGVRCVFDVRHTPVSMYKPDFSKSNLQRHLAAELIDYVHMPDLGVPRDIRSKTIGHKDRAAIWEWYDAHVAEQFCGNLHRFFNSADHPIAFMCTEIDPTSCHRHRLALALEKNGLKGFDA